MPRDIEKKLFDFYVSGFVMWSSLLLASTVAFFTLLLDKTVGTKPLFGFLHSILLGVLQETKTGKKSKHIVRRERKSIQIESPKGNKATSIHLGINVLASVVINDGTWLLYKGVRTKEDYLEKRITEVQSLASRTKNINEYEAYDELNREKRWLFKNQEVTSPVQELRFSLAQDTS
jgi:transposase